ncbi:PREDICTED: uncharacterized protein LOC106916235 [Poecilia mexicana]|uniref:uncharacterized protein LOC106916235 n=1 Tax=Poecilia mexicana TaxID=48701 RepID=UPI00072DA928|nr:PREDICTED: uncharacterized protein LOC106916235 [Poecilia mexicana]
MLLNRLWLLVILTGGYFTKKALDTLGASGTNPFSSSREETGPGYVAEESAFSSVTKTSSFISESPGNMSPPGPFPMFQPGEASYKERTYEQGDYNSESEDRGPPPQYLPVLPLNEFAIDGPQARGTLVARFRQGCPLLEYVLLSMRYPPGMYTFSTDQLDHRRNQRHDGGHVGDPYRCSQLETYPNRKRHPLRSPQQNIGKAGYGVH